MVRWLSGLGWIGLWFSCAGALMAACGGVVSTDGGGGSSSSAGTSPAVATCAACENERLTCVSASASDGLERTAVSSTGCSYGAGSSVSLSVDCAAGTVCLVGIQCAKYSASGSTFSVNTSLGRLSCSPSGH